MTHLCLKTVCRQTLPLEKISTNARITPHGDQHMGHLDQAGAPETTTAIGLFQQLLKILTDEQFIAAGHRLISQKSLQLIKQFFAIEAEGIHQLAVMAIAEQHLEQMLHIQLTVTPTAGEILPGQKKLPGVIAEAIRLSRETGGRFNAGAGRRGHGGLNLVYAASERDESWINSTL